MEPSVFLPCVGGSDPVSASGSAALSLPKPSQRRGRGLCSLTCAVLHPSLAAREEGSVLQGRAWLTETLGCPCLLWGAQKQAHSTHSTHTPARCPAPVVSSTQTLPSPPCWVCLNICFLTELPQGCFARPFPGYAAVTLTTGKRSGCHQMSWHSSLGPSVPGCCPEPLRGARVRGSVRVVLVRWF